MKKLKTYICLAAVLLLTTQALMAQTQPLTATEPTSGVGEATNSRFVNDVDLFFSVNDWADLEFSKWFGYLRMQNLDTAEVGLALQLSKAYLGLYYYGKFNEGDTNVGTRTYTYDDNGNPVITAPDFSGFDFTPGGTAAGIMDGTDLADIDNGITRANYYGVLLGWKTHGFKFSVLDNRTKVDLPFVYTPSAIDVDGDGKDDGEKDLPANTVGVFTKREGAVIPKLQWGAATDMTFGKYRTRPSASLAFAVIYKDYEFSDLHTVRGGKTFDNIQDYSQNTLIPTLGVDTGGINFRTGDWGTLAIGASEEFSILINGEGNGKARKYAEKSGATDDDSVLWQNRLTPYATFSYQGGEYFALGAKLSVPIWLGWSDAATNKTFFGVGAKGMGVGYDENGVALTDPVTQDRPLLETGFQLKGSVFSKLSDRFGILEKVIFNWGIKVNLPAFLYDGVYTVTHYADDAGVEDPALGISTITKSGTRQWLPVSKDDWLNEVSGGFTFFITPNAVLDISIGTRESDDLFAKVLISVKHNGSRRAASGISAE